LLSHADFQNQVSAFQGNQMAQSFIENVLVVSDRQPSELISFDQDADNCLDTGIYSNLSARITIVV
jgi:hypothetical protein